MNLAARKSLDHSIQILCLIAAAISCSFLIFIVLYLIIGAIPALDLSFIFNSESDFGRNNSAIGNAVSGTILISLLAALIATPFALGTAIYLTKYAKKSLITDAFRFLIEVLSGTPSIVIGIFGFLVFVVYMKQITGGYSLIAGALGLSILIIPVIERSTEEAISSISRELEEGSYALGASKWQTIRGITIPTAISGIFTGAILGFGRAAEESAVVLFTVGYSQYMPEFAIKTNRNMILGIKFYPIQDLVGTLPLSVYNAYQSAYLVPMANAFATAFVLVCVVLTINIIAKFVVSQTLDPMKKRRGGIMSGFILSKLKKYIAKGIVIPKKPGELQVKQQQILDQKTDKTQQSMPPNESKPIQSSSIIEDRMPNPPPPVQKIPIPSSKLNIRTFLRALLPFVIPSALLLLIAFLATIPPLHHALGPVSPSLVRLFAIGLYLIVMIVSVVFGILLAKKAGVFKGKSRHIGFAGVATGVCLLCIAGIICALAAPGIFSTGEQPLSKGTTDRKALLASLIAEFEATDGGTSSAPIDNTVMSSSAPNHPSPGMNTSSGVIIPVKDALSLGESYQYGDATRTCSATVYDYTVLPFYFWWFIDYNRFVQQIPHTGNSYLVVFIRIENIGTHSAIVPSAEKIQISNNGKIYSHDPYFNTSVLSSSQIQYYSDHYEQLPYQWIRELGQDKRDYAFLTGYNIFGEWKFASPTITATTKVTATPTVTDSTTSTNNSSSTTNGKGFFIKPGPGNAIDGYLIFEVPDSVVKQDIDKTYVDISFNANSGTRWRLK